VNLFKYSISLARQTARPEHNLDFYLIANHADIIRTGRTHNDPLRRSRLTRKFVQ
jgi:hypothetical protein